jgi:hypothetical protein
MDLSKGAARVQMWEELDHADRGFNRVATRMPRNVRGLETSAVQSQASMGPRRPVGNYQRKTIMGIWRVLVKTLIVLVMVWFSKELTGQSF